MRMRRLSIVAITIVGCVGLAASAASAATIAIGVGAFGAGSTLTTFTGLPDGTEVNGLTVDGMQFLYSLGNSAVVIDGGPGLTNNIEVPNIVSVGNATGVLTVTLPSLIDAFGYGFAVLATATIPNATTISIFNGATPLGSISYDGVPDPTFAGGFAGIQSTLPFDRAQITFSTQVPAFALDNIRTIPSVTTVPEPATLLMVGTGIGAMVRRRRP